MSAVAGRELIDQALRPRLDEFLALAENANLVPVAVELHADLVTPIAAYLLLVGDRAGFLLESAEGGERIGRYTFIGLDPWETITTQGEDPLTVVSQRLSRYRPAKLAGLPRFTGGAVGYVGYDCAAYFEPRLASPIKARPADLAAPEAAFMLCGTLLIFDNLRRRLTLLINVRLDDGRDPGRRDRAAAAYRQAAADLAALFERLHDAREAFRAGSLRPPPAPAAASTLLENVTSNMTKAEFCAAVEKARQYIAAGDIFQVVLSQRFTRKIHGDAFTIYRALRALNPSPYLFFINFPNFSLVGSSPEVMVRLEDGRITLRPIAGTRPRGRDEAEDARLAEELLADEKECAEHLMLVDLGRNDVGRVAAAGTVKVDELMVIERYSHVMHIVSNVVGTLATERSAADVIRSAFPAGTVSGAPKIRAMEIIAELEKTRRGAYAGAAGYLGFDGNADTAIILRTVLVHGQEAHVQAGAGIVFDSVPEREYEETLNKAAAMLRALDWAERGIA